MIRVQVRFTGRVQGVGFRATARWVAGSFPVSGWVRNEPDGSVLLEAEGEAGAVEAYLAALGERMAGFISTASRVRLTPTGESGFAVLR